jgi:ferredoxin--NADP+ reductase
MSSVTTPTDPILPDAKMNLVTPKAPVMGRVVTSELCMKGKSASFVRHVAFDVSGTPLAGNFLAGQSFGVIPPGLDERGKPHAVRLYSIACPSRGEDGMGNVVSTTPKRVVDERKPQKPEDDPDDHRLFLGVCSNYLCDVRVGDEVLLTGPSGKRFLLPTDPSQHDYLFVATGTGIAPFRGMLMELLNNLNGPCPSRMHLVMGVPYSTDLLYDDLFRRYAKEHENFTYWTAVSRELREGGRRGLYVDALIEERMDEFRDLIANPRTLIYVCGLAGMQVGLYRVLGRQGLGEGYLSVGEELAGIEPNDWTEELIKRRIRPTKRMMLEVY